MTIRPELTEHARVIRATLAGLPGYGLRNFRHVRALRAALAALEAGATAEEAKDYADRTHGLPFMAAPPAWEAAGTAVPS